MDLYFDLSFNDINLLFPTHSVFKYGFGNFASITEPSSLNLFVCNNISLLSLIFLSSSNSVLCFLVSVFCKIIFVLSFVILFLIIVFSLLFICIKVIASAWIICVLYKIKNIYVLLIHITTTHYY